MATQPIATEMTDEQLQQHAFEVLSRELGLANYARFLRLFGSGRGDYTAERQSQQADVKLEDILQRLNTDQKPWSRPVSVSSARSSG